MSNRHLNQIIAIKPDFSGVDWKLGGVGSDFTFPNPSDQFYHQHDVKMLPNGDILLFDNGQSRPDDQGGQYSRAEELKLDFTTMQATKVWEYRNVPDLFSSAVGSAVRLSNGNTVVDFGVDPVTEDPSIFTVVEADPNGNPVASYHHKLTRKGRPVSGHSNRQPQRRNERLSFTREVDLISRVKSQWLNSTKGDPFRNGTAVSYY